MDRRRFLLNGFTLTVGSSVLVGCRHEQHGELIRDDKKDMVGSHAAGAETYKPLIDEALSKLLARQDSGLQPAAVPPPAPKRICFVGVENKSSEEIGDFKEQIKEILETRVNNSGSFVVIASRFAAAGLREARLRPDELFIPRNQRTFLAVMESQGKPFDYLLFAAVTSGTTRASDSKTQKDYMLTLDLVNIENGTQDKESASIRKGYYK
jgi:hypothetical protein